MRILHACKHFYPRVTGVTAHVEHLAVEQRALGHTVAVATWGEPGEAEDAHAPFGLEVLRAPTGDNQGLAGLMADFAPDIVHAHSIWDVTHAAARTARRRGWPYVVTTHGTWNLLAASLAKAPWRDRLRWGLWQRRVLWPRLLRRAGAVIALNALEETDARRAGVPAARVVRIPNAVDVQRFFPTTQDMGDMENAGDADGGDVFPVLFVGAMEENKGIFEIIRAASLLRESLPQVRWLFCGDGPDLGRARQAAAESGVGEAVVFLGRVGRSEMPALYQRVRAVAAPSRMEAFSTALLEAMASGLPCVGSEVGGTPDIIDHGETGILVSPGDAAALAEAVRWLARHPRESRAMGVAGRDKAEREFAWGLVAGRIEKAYRLALAALFFCLFLCRPALAARVFPVDILTMVDPRTGQSVATADVGWREANAVWDGQAVRLAAARGEVAAFQLVIVPDPDERLENIRISVDLPGQASFRAYRAWHLWDAPEVAVPLGPGAGGDGAPFAIPAVSPAERAVTRDYAAFATVVELAVSREAGSPVLAGRVRLDWDGGGVALPLELAVLPLTLPDRPAFTLEMNSYGDYLRLLPADTETFLGLHRLFRQFRCTFTLVPYRQSGRPVLDFLAPSLPEGGEPDFTDFDAALSGLFDGTAFADGRPLDHFLLPLQANWPVAWETRQPVYARRNIALRLALARHLRDKGWLATRFQEFHNENPEHGAQVPWRLDEPVSPRDMAGHELFLGFHQTARAAFGPECPVRYRIDISNWRPLLSRLRRLAGRVTDWSVSADPAFLDRRAATFFRELGGQWLFAYGELPGFRADGRPTPWWRFPLALARFEALGLNGYAQWQADRWQDSPLAEVPREAVPLFYSSASGARDFIWPGTFFGQNGALPSLRLFALREGLNLLDYLALACACRPDMAEGLRAELASLSGAGAIWTFKTRLARLATGRCGS